MPDLADIEAAMVTVITATLYPAGTGQASLFGVPCRIYRGWPTPTTLNSDLVSGVVNVTVAPDPDIGRTTTRFALHWTKQASDRTLFATVRADKVSIVGKPAVGQSIGILVDGHAFTYQVRGADSIGGVAANLAAMIRSSRVVHLVGNDLIIPGAVQLVARTVTNGKAFREARRQERDIRAMAWCPGADLRDQIVGSLDHAFARVPFLLMADDIQARITYKGTSIYDQAQNSQLYRRDLIYTVEYPTILSDDVPAMLFGDLGFNAATLTA